MKKRWLKLCSLVLVIVMTVNSLPMNVFAEQYQSSKSTPQETTTAAEQLEEQSAADHVDARITEECIDGRTEYSKEFLLDNGTHLAVVYDSAVHYEKDGNWEEIDNTLQVKPNGTITNKAGVWDVAFPQQIDGSSQISITKDGHTLSFGMAGELHQQGDLEVMSEGEENSSSIITPDESSDSETMLEAATPETEAAEVTLSEDITQAEEVMLQEGEPEETIPAESVPEETIPEISSAAANVTEQDTTQLTTSIMTDGAVQTFAVSAVRAASGQIQTIDRQEALAEAEHAETVLEKPVSQLLYADVYTNTDIQYDLVGNQVKESIILESYSSTLRGYRYTLNTGDMIPVLNDDDSIHFYDSSMETVVMVMPAPYLEDKNLEHCEDIQVNLSGGNGVYTLSYLLPLQWLAEEDRAWPVVLDPVVTADSTMWNIQDQTVMSAKEYSHTWGALQIGQSATSGICRPYVAFKNLPSLYSSDVIINATISLYNPNSGTKTILTTVHKVDETWNSSTLQWDNMPSFQTDAEDYALVSGGGWYHWEVTDIVRGWYSGENTGMMFKASDEDEAVGPGHYKQFYSSDWGTPSYLPHLTITYRNNNGLESYWDYTSSSAGRAGTGHINQYTGNLVWVHNDLGFGGNRMPVSISHIYNANDTAVTRFGMGNGWRTNFNQRVYQWSANTNYYIWEDSDGTSHYFLKESSGIYKDEDGLELTLTTTGSGTTKYCITDKYGSKSYFDTYGRLTKQENNQATKSSITVAYTTTSGYLIQSVTDGAGRKYNFTYSSNLLSKITYVGTGSSEITSVSYGYTNSNLTSITYKDGKRTAFTYGANNLLTSATDVDGYALKFEYNTTAAGQPSRVSKLSEFSGSTAGGVMNFEYAHNQTTLTDYNGNVQILQFNNMGNTVCIQDGEGHAQYAKYAKNNSGESAKGNQLTAASKLQNTVGNLLNDSSFESSTLWTAASGTVAISGSGYLGSKSLAVTGGRVNSSTFSVAAGESCTFSAYVKTTASGASLALYAGGSAVASQSFPASSTWTRVEVNYTNTSSSAKALSAALQCASGQTVYMDCVQAEKSPTASRYNLVQNGDFRFSGSPAQSWTGSGTTSSDVRATVSTGAAPQLDTNVMKIVGAPMGTKKLSQTIPVSGSAGDTYVVAGWAQADSVPLNVTGQNREFGIRLVFNNTDGTTTTAVAQFNPDTNNTANWQYSAAAAVAAKAYSSMRVEIAYDYNANTAYFDGIQLYKEEYGQSYTYDDDGNVTSVTDLQKKTEYEYQNNNLTKEMIDENVKMTYEYDNYHNVTKATTANNVVYSFTYDQYGNNTSVTVTNNGVSLKSIANYSTDGNRLLSTKDATGHLTRYGYNEKTNVLNWVQYPEDTTSTRTNYTYDNMYRMVAAAATTDTGLALSASYTYTNDNLTKLQTGSTTYTFAYGNFALRSNVKIGSRTLASYTYTSRNNYLDTLAYGNGDSVKYTYDKQGRVTKQTYEDGDTVSYRYDNNGALATVTDSGSGITTTYYYDFIDRMMKYTETGGSYNNSVAYAYDTLNNLTQVLQTVQGREYNTVYAYDDDNRVTSINTGAAGRQYTYDAYGRVSRKTTKHGSSTVKTDSFTFKAPSSTATSAQVSSHTVDAASYDKTYTYTYDNNGNILTVSNGSKTTSYVYDSANQLTRENNQAAGKTWTWTYDNAGNILAKKEYAYTTGTLGTVQKTVNYAYGDSAWGDLLTSHDGKTITYDTIGNPLSDGTWNYTWEHGRELASMSNSSGTWNFTYNADGLRTKRTNGSTTYNYTYVGDRLSYMTVGSDRIYFIYDAEGVPIAARWNDANYYYVSNIQGDIVAIVNSTGTAVVEYTYDAWGNIISTTGSMASTLGTLNPLRYRAYVYDQEVGLYYLQSRYYNPTTGRFLNADALASTGQGLLGTNMFAYCNNNPANYLDTLGSRCVAIEPLGGGAKQNPKRPDNTLSTAEKITILMFETAYAVLDGIEAEAAIGMGFGGSVSVNLYGISADVNLFATTRCAIVIDDGMIDIRSITSFGGEIGVTDYLGLGGIKGVSHSFFDPECTCTMNSSFKDMTLCKANKPFYDNVASIGVSAGGYFVIGGEAALGYDFKTFADSAMRAYENLF